MAAESITSLIFKVHRREPELIIPAKPTPHEFLQLSDIDNQQTFKFHIPNLHFYPYNPSMEGKDPVKVINNAIGKTLVFYYPLAGRLREGPNRKLIVECTGEGVLFIEADADVTLDKFGDPLMPPFPCSDQLLFDVPDSSGILNCPLLLIQVTRLRCGGFIFGIRLNHTLCDAPGLVQFMSAIAEIAKGATTPSVVPVWERHVFCARNPPQVKYQHCEYDQVLDTKNPPSSFEERTFKSFFFGPKELSKLRRFIPPSHQPCSNFEILTAFVWKHLTIALQPDPIGEMTVMSIVNLRKKLDHLVPAGYYGGALIFSGAVTTVKELSQKPLSFGIELVRKLKENVTEDYVRSIIDLMIIKDRPRLANRCIAMSDVTRAGFREVDFGWGEALFAGPLIVPPIGCFFISVKDGIVLLIHQPDQVIERFVKEMNNVLQGVSDTYKPKSAL